MSGDCSIAYKYRSASADRMRLFNRLSVDCELTEITCLPATNGEMAGKRTVDKSRRVPIPFIPPDYRLVCLAGIKGELIGTRGRAIE